MEIKDSTHKAFDRLLLALTILVYIRIIANVITHLPSFFHLFRSFYY